MCAVALLSGSKFQKKQNNKNDTIGKNSKMSALIAKVYESNELTIEAAHKVFSGVLKNNEG